MKRDSPDTGVPSLDPATVVAVRKSFASLAPVADEIAERFYERLFVQSPQLRRLFPVQLVPQRKKLVDMLVTIAAMLDDIPRFNAVLRDLGLRHDTFGAKPQHYEFVTRALTATIAEFAGPLWSSKLERDWSGVLSLVCEQMQAGART